MSEPAIIKQAQIMRPEDFTELRIVDWNRWRYSNIYGAMQNLPNWLVSCWYTIVEWDLSCEPLRDGFDWGHYGDSHHKLGHQYWSFFNRCFPDGEIDFTDAPDFSGSFMDNGVKREFMGDIGTVSASAFFLNAVPRLREGDLWITVHERQQIIIEASYDIATEIGKSVGHQLGLDTAKIQERAAHKSPQQLVFTWS